MFENQPKGLFALALANTGERFGYYTMLAIFALFLQANFGWGEGLTEPCSPPSSCWSTSCLSWAVLWPTDWASANASRQVSS